MEAVNAAMPPPRVGVGVVPPSIAPFFPAVKAKSLRCGEEISS